MTKKSYILDGNSLEIEDIWEISNGNFKKISISKNAKEKIKVCHSYLLAKVQSKKTLYGINTGFGALSDQKITLNQIEKLQENIIKSHAVGVGELFADEFVRVILLLRINCLCQGHSGISQKTLDRLLYFLNNDILPLIPKKGSVGASGDLAPLSHMALPLIGEGEVLYLGKKKKAKAVLQSLKMNPIKLGPKEGLALINGTQIMTTQAVLALKAATLLIKQAEINAALGLEGLAGTNAPYIPEISLLRKHPGQIASSKNLHALTCEVSEIRKDYNEVQDPYSFRCIPQVHGSVRETLSFAKKIIKTEINSVTDNPLIFPQKDLIVSGGNFHGQVIASSLDYMAMAIHELGSMSERRIEKLLNPKFSKLPPFLTPLPGINSGLMILQVTAAALVSQNKHLSLPCSIDSIPTQTDKEDHVSMGPNAGNKLAELIINLQDILAIELLVSSQAIYLREPLRPNKVLRKVHHKVSLHMKKIKHDRLFYQDIQKLKKLIQSNEIIKIVEKEIGQLETF